MYGTGFLKGIGITFRHFVNTFIDDIRWFGRKKDRAVFQERQGMAVRGLFTVEYPEEKLAVPERFRFLPFLVIYNNDDPEYPGKDWCTSCGICAKVCPPQCIWIVRGTNPVTGRPKPEPEKFYIDIDICMNCGYCAEYCPFDAIKMDHNYELASYDRTGAHVYDKARLIREMRYWESIAPTTAAEELVARGGYDHTDVQKTRKKAGLTPSRSGPVKEAPVAKPEPVAAAPAPAAVKPAEPAPAAKPAEAAPAPVAEQAAPPVAEKPAEPAPTPTAPEGTNVVRRGKREINLGEQPKVVHRRSKAPPEEKK